MPDRRLNNVLIFEDTLELIENSEKLQDAISNSIRRHQLYLESDDVSVPGVSGNVCRTVVSTGRSFEAASSYARAGKKVCVLNFASASDPGGGVTYGSSAQEESLCRCSTLYPCLNEDEMWEKFYLPHRNNNKSDSLHNDDCIYTPEVVVIKSDISFPERLPESAPLPPLRPSMSLPMAPVFVTSPSLILLYLQPATQSAAAKTAIIVVNFMSYSP